MTQAERTDFGAWFETELQRKGWSCNHFAHSSGIVTSTTYKWKKNEQRPSPRHCVTIADTFGRDLDTVLAAAGHRVRDDTAPGVIRTEIAAMLKLVPEELLVTVVPMLRALTEPHTQAETRQRLHHRLTATAD